MAKALALANMSKILRDMANGPGNGIGNRHKNRFGACGFGFGDWPGYRTGIMHKYANDKSSPL